MFVGDVDFEENCHSEASNELSIETLREYFVNILFKLRFNILFFPFFSLIVPKTDESLFEKTDKSSTISNVIVSMDVPETLFRQIAEYFHLLRTLKEIHGPVLEGSKLLNINSSELPLYGFGDSIYTYGD